MEFERATRNRSHQFRIPRVVVESIDRETLGTAKSALRRGSGFHSRSRAAGGVRCQRRSRRHVTALLEAGLLNRTESGEIEFPYEAIKVEFLLQAA